VEELPDLRASSNIILKKSQVIQAQTNHILCFDNWYTFINLFVELAKQEILPITATRSNRLLRCSIKPEKELKKEGRGSFEEKEERNDGVDMQVVRWFDNSAVTTASTYTIVQPLLSIERYGTTRAKKKEITIPCHQLIVHRYINQNI